MPTAWVAWRRILSCKQDSHVAVYDPKGTNSTATVTAAPSPTYKAPNRSTPNNTKGHANAFHYQVKKRRSTSSSVCCNDLKNVVHGNTRVMHRGDQDSPLSHHHSSPHQLKVLLQEPSLLPYSPRVDAHLYAQRSSAHHARKISTSCYDCSIASCEPPDSFSPNSFNGLQSRENGNLYAHSTCNKCGDNVSDVPEVLEEHYATHHTVTELKGGDSAMSIVEIIFQTSWLRQDIACARPERIFKVHNSPKTIAKFEDYREMVKMKASKISKKHSRCLVDGNELLRFYSTTVACRMGKTRTSSSSSPWTTSLCASASCGVCQILKHGFPTKGQPGIYTNASSGQAHDSTMFSKEYDNAANAKRAMLVCRVIAGRVKKSGYESSQDGPISGYDSVAGEAGLYTDMEELLVFNNKAVLPCFVVVYSC